MLTVGNATHTPSDLLSPSTLQHVAELCAAERVGAQVNSGSRPEIMMTIGSPDDAQVSQTEIHGLGKPCEDQCAMQTAPSEP